MTSPVTHSDASSSAEDRLWQSSSDARLEREACAREHRWWHAFLDDALRDNAERHASWRAFHDLYCGCQVANLDIPFKESVSHA